MGGQLALQKYKTLPSPSDGSVLFSALLGGKYGGAPWDHITSQNQTSIYISFKNACITFSFKITGLVVWNICLEGAIIPWSKLLITYYNHSPSRPPLFVQMNHFQRSAFVLLPHVIIPENNLSSSKTWAGPLKFHENEYSIF